MTAMPLVKSTCILIKKCDSRESVRSSIDSPVVNKPCSKVVVHYRNVSRGNIYKSSSISDNAQGKSYSMAYKSITTD